jgi:hypothetical protein
VGLTEDLGRGPIGLDTAIFILWVTRLEALVVPYRTGDELVDRYELVLTRSRGLRLFELDRPLLRTAARLRPTIGVKTPDALQLRDHA